jgi:hypothetical protein
LTPTGKYEREGQKRNPVVTGKPWKERTSTKGNRIIDTYGGRERRTHENDKISRRGIKRGKRLNLLNRTNGEDEFLLSFCLLPAIQ